MGTLTNWVVYETPEGKVEAVKDTGHLVYDDLRAEHNVIRGFVVFKHKVDAIDYVKQVIL